MTRTLLSLWWISVLAFTACRNEPPPTFLLGYYDYQGGWHLGGQTYHFTPSGVNEHWFTDLGPQLEGVDVGSYHLDGSRVVLTFPGRYTNTATLEPYRETLYWTVLGRTSFLLTQESWDYLQAFHVLAGRDYWVRTGDRPPMKEAQWPGYRRSQWQHLLRRDPELRRYVPKEEGGKWTPPRPVANTNSKSA